MCKLYVGIPVCYIYFNVHRYYCGIESWKFKISTDDNTFINLGKQTVSIRIKKV